MPRGILRAAFIIAVVMGGAASAYADAIESEDIIVGSEAPPPAPVAQEQPALDRSGPFLGVGVNYFVEDFTDTGVLDFGDTWGFNLRGGYRFNDYLAAEAVLEYANDYSAELTTAAGICCGYEDKVSETLWTLDFAVNAKAILPLGRFEPYVSGGIGFLYGNELAIVDEWEENEVGDVVPTKLSATSDPVVFLGRVAVGVDVAVSESFGVFFETAYLMPTSDYSDNRSIGFTLGGRVTF